MTPDCSKSVPSMPKETARAANAIFGRSNFYIMIGESLNSLLEEILLQDSTEKECESSMQGAIWSLITFFQFFEGLTDEQAVDAVRTRIDWKFALHLSLIPARLHEHVFCEFRQKILASSPCQSEFQKLMDRLIGLVPPFKNNFQNLKSLEVVTCVCSINRLHHAQQAMQQALGALAARLPDWLRKNALPHWYGRYSHVTPRVEVAILLGQQQFLMEEIGADIHYLLEKIQQSCSQELMELPEVKALNRVWVQQFKGLNLTPNHWPENLQDCNHCAYQGKGRRQ